VARTRAKDHDAKRAEIMRIAARTFAVSGYHATSMSAVAAECGISKALVYHYYDGKEALLHDIIRTHLLKLIAAIDAVPAAPDPEKRLHALVSALLHAYQDSDAEHKVQLSAMEALPAAYREDLVSLERRLVTVFADTIRALKPDLFADRPLLKPVTMSLFGMLNWVYMWFRDGGPISRKDYADLATDLFVNGVRAMDR